MNAASGAARAPRGYYQLVEGHQGGFMFTLRAGNHETILESRVYWSRQAALDAVEAVRMAHKGIGDLGIKVRARRALDHRHHIAM